MDYFDGKVVLVTGGARGIGYATAELLGRRGARVVISDILQEALARAEAELTEKGFPALAIRSDVTSPSDCQALVTAAVDRFGKIDALINNAGISIVDYFDQCRPETCKKLFEVNLLGPVYMSLAALDELKKSRGQLVFVSSVSGIRAIPTGSLYSASKAALRSLAESLRIELKPHGVHVGVICPGFTTSESSKTVMKGDGAPRPIDRPPHDTPEGVARGIARLLERRERERVLTAFGKAAAFLQRLSPSLVDRYLQGRELKN